MSRVFITGADRGLGLALSRQYLQEGHTVYAGQYMPGWKELEQLATVYHERLCCIPLDVGNRESLCRAREMVSERAGGLDVLIHNAGMMGPQQAIREGVNQEETMRVYEINALGPLRTTEILLPLMKQGERKLCFVSSEAGSIALTHRSAQYAYSMSKAALNMAVRMLHNELKPQGYSFYLYHPGWMRTYMLGSKATVGDMEPEESARSAYAMFAKAAPAWLELVDVYGRAWAF